VRPLFAEGRADLVDDNARSPTKYGSSRLPTHRQATLRFRISSKGQDAVITGDLMHHPIHAAIPNGTTNSTSICAGQENPALVLTSAMRILEILVLGNSFRDTRRR